MKIEKLKIKFCLFKINYFINYKMKYIKRIYPHTTNYLLQSNTEMKNKKKKEEKIDI